SASDSVTVALPLLLLAGVKLSVPADETAGWAENSALLSLLTVKVRVWPLSLLGPALTAVAQPVTLAAPESSLTVWLAPLVNDGASLTAVTAIEKVWPALWSTPPPAVPPSSNTVTVTVAAPLALPAGV